MKRSQVCDHVRMKTKSIYFLVVECIRHFLNVLAAKDRILDCVAGSTSKNSRNEGVSVFASEVCWEPLSLNVRSSWLSRWMYTLLAPPARRCSKKVKYLIYLGIKHCTTFREIKVLHLQWCSEIVTELMSLSFFQPFSNLHVFIHGSQKCISFRIIPFRWKFLKLSVPYQNVMKQTPTCQIAHFWL